jgi:hypothetical protein
VSELDSEFSPRNTSVLATWLLPQPFDFPLEARRNTTIDVLTPVVLPFDIVPESIDSERQKTAEALVDLLEGEIVNLNTRQAYKIAWRNFLLFAPNPT